MTENKFNKADTDLANLIHQIWIAASLSKILRNSLEYGSNINKIDTLYLSNAVEQILQKQKHKIVDIKENIFGVK